MSTRYTHAAITSGSVEWIFKTGIKKLKSTVDAYGYLLYGTVRVPFNLIKGENSIPSIGGYPTAILFQGRTSGLGIDVLETGPACITPVIDANWITESILTSNEPATGGPSA